MSPRKQSTILHKLQFALTAVLLVALVGGGAGAAAAADTSEAPDSVDSTTVVNDHDLVDTDETLNDLNTNVLGVANQDSPVDLL